MAYKLKTLLVFDTNSLRSTDAGEVAYSTFSFGRAYYMITEFIRDNDLSKEVTLVIPAMVIEELKQQKQRQYQKDINQLKEIAKRLTGLPHIKKPIEIPDESFNFADYVEQEAITYFKNNKVNILQYSDVHAPSILRSMLIKVVGLDKPRSPFAITKSYNDAGFKDSVIWETLMHYEGVVEYDKVVFFTKDGDYQENCVLEFKAKWNKHIAIQKDENTVLAELKRDYENYIDNRKIYDYAQTEYFTDYLKDRLTPASFIQINGEDLHIQNYIIRQNCQRVEVDKDEDGDFDQPIIISDVLIYTVQNGQKLEVSVTVKTILSDFEYMEISGITFNPTIF